MPRHGRRILIIGTSGIGKRALGSVLALERGFRQLDAIVATAEGRFELLRAMAKGRDVVIIWPGPLLGALHEWLPSVGFEPIWLDADRGALRPRGVRFVDPFRPDGSFRPLGQLVAEVLTPIEPAAARDIAPPPSRRRVG